MEITLQYQLNDTIIHTFMTNHQVQMLIRKAIQVHKVNSMRNVMPILTLSLLITTIVVSYPFYEPIKLLLLGIKQQDLQLFGPVFYIYQLFSST